PEEETPPAVRTDRRERSGGILDEDDVAPERLRRDRGAFARGAQDLRAATRGRRPHRQRDRRLLRRAVRVRLGIEPAEPHRRQSLRARLLRDDDLFETARAGGGPRGRWGRVGGRGAGGV